MTVCSVCEELAGEETCVEVGIDAREIEYVGKILRLKLCIACQSKAIEYQLQICLGCKDIVWLVAEVKEIREGRVRYTLKQVCDKCSKGLSDFTWFGPYMG